MLLFQLLQVSVGVSSKLSSVPSIFEWEMLYSLARKQALLGVCLYSVQKLPKEQIVNLPMGLKK